MASHLRAALAVVSCLLAASAVRAGDMCPAPPKRKSAPATPISSGDHLIRIDTDGASLTSFTTGGFAVFTGHVQVRQDERTIAADRVTYDAKTGKVTVNGSVDFEDPPLGIKSDSGIYDALGGAEFAP